MPGRRRDARPRAAPPEPAEAKSLTLTGNRGLFCGMGSVKDAMGADNILTVNALTEEQHAGGGTNYGRPGRIPGSVCVAARGLTDPAQNHRFLPLDQLRQQFEAAGVLSAPQVITYCGGGIAASGDAFILHLLGRDNVQVYDASLQEWARSDLPMEVD